MNSALLAKLTGGLGDSATVAKLCSTFAQVYTEFLPDVIKSETGLDVTVGYVGCESGLISDLIAELGENVALADVSLRNWSPNIVLSCGSGFVITLMEHLLGALPDVIEEPSLRPLSVIELDLAVMVFDKISGIMRSAVNAAGGFEPIIGRPHNIDDRPKRSDDHVDEYGATVRMSIKLGPVTSEFALVIPQKTLLKTKIVAPKAKGQSAAATDWAEQLSEQVRRSQVTLEARIKLQSLTLGTISKLAAGDVIPFFESGDVRVDVSANSKELYVCEFGRSGENYTVRVKDNVNPDHDLLKHIMN